MTLLLACLWLTDRYLPRLFPRRYARRRPSGIAGVALWLAILIGLPVLAVLLGHATGRLPSPPPYPD